MNLKKLLAVSHCAFPKANVACGFGLALVSFLNFLFILYLSSSYNSHNSNISNNGSLITWSFSYNTTSTLNFTYSKVINFEDTHKIKLNYDAINETFIRAIDVSPNEGKMVTGQEKGNGSNSDLHNKANGKTSQVFRNVSSKSRECDIFDGRWVRDDTKPYYEAGSCRYVERAFNCHRNKRPDNDFVKWRWQPYGCELPSLNATEFLERLRGKKVVFVGDSINRNMCESLICILRNSLMNKRRVYEIPGSLEFQKHGHRTFRFQDYKCTVVYIKSPFLVRGSSFNAKSDSFATLRLDLMDSTTSLYKDADILIFNTGHWWTHEKTSRGKNYYQEGNHIYPRLKVLDAYTRALSTWAKWVDNNIDSRKTQVIFMGYASSHFRGGQWNSGGKCHKETEPIFNTSYLTNYPPKMLALDGVLRVMKTPVTFLNITRLTDYRKDGHPSIYGRFRHKAMKPQVGAMPPQDCGHWCLPGVPDTWNELLYASLLKTWRG